MVRSSGRYGYCHRKKRIFNRDAHYVARPAVKKHVGHRGETLVRSGGAYEYCHRKKRNHGPQ